MRYLATGTPKATFDGNHVILTVPSGNGEIEIALNPGNHCQFCIRELEAASVEAFDQRTRRGAEIIQFPAKSESSC